eukprot:scaffold50861_cov63-Phaeocystis_antarctica.AAC.1
MPALPRFDCLIAISRDSPERHAPPGAAGRPGRARRGSRRGAGGGGAAQQFKVYGFIIITNTLTHHSNIRVVAAPHPAKHASSYQCIARYRVRGSTELRTAPDHSTSSESTLDARPDDLFPGLSDARERRAPVPPVPPPPPPPYESAISARQVGGPTRGSWPDGEPWGAWVSVSVPVSAPLVSGRQHCTKARAATQPRLKRPKVSCGESTSSNVSTLCEVAKLVSQKITMAMPMATARTESGSTSASTVHMRPAQLIFHQKNSETSATATTVGRSHAKP